MSLCLKSWLVYIRMSLVLACLTLAPIPFTCSSSMRRWRPSEPEASTKSTVRLMQYLKADGTIKKAGVEAVVAAVEKAMGLVKEYEITQLLVLATSALREAPNGSRILKRIENVVASRSRCCPVWMRPDSPSLQLAAGMVGMPVGCWSSISVVALSRWLWVRMRIPQ